MLRMDVNSSYEILPFLKWAGGKRWLVTKYSSIFPNTYNRYIEPFLGSGAVFFKLQPNESILSDINEELINTYIALKKNWKRVFNKLKEHHRHHCKEYYYSVRNSKPRSLFTKASRFIYLNRTCWNGLYRVNLKGFFNVPIGTKTEVITPEDDFQKVSRLLKKAQLKHLDFEKIIDLAERDDLIFVDPPYSAKNNDNGFIKYNNKLFSWDDQVRLRDCLMRAKRRHVKILATNSAHESVHELFRNDFQIVSLTRYSLIAGDASKRKPCKELLITN